MKLQLTKDKTIDVALPWEKKAGGSGGHRQGPGDVVGVVLGDDDPRGCPAVRLQRRKDGIHIQAVGFVQPPGYLPKSWEELKNKTTWELPVSFQAAQAALAVVSPNLFIRQTTDDALAGEWLSPGAAAPKKKLGIRRPEAEGQDETAKAATTDDFEKPLPFEPVSRNGMRSVMGPLAEAPFVLQTGLPEYQVLWLARLLPEGRRPTACSVQTVPAAILSALAVQPEFLAANGTAVAVFVQRRTIFFAAYREGEVVLFRECPGGVGSQVLHEQVRISLGVEDEIVDSFLEEGLVDPTPALEPIMRPVLQQLKLSLDYLAQRHEVHVKHVFLMGLPSGAAFWSLFAQEVLGLPFISPGVFEGMLANAKGDVASDLLVPVASQVFLGAVGAALAAMEGN